MYQLYVGIDISAKTAHIHWHHPQQQTAGKLEIPQNKGGHTRLVNKLYKLCPDPSQVHVVMEATGNYWLTLALFVHEQDFAVSVINPIQGKRFAQMTLRRTKTDPIDAQMLCDFVQTMQPALWTPPPLIYYQLQQRLALRGDLVQARSRSVNQRHAMTQHPHAEDSLCAIHQHLIDMFNQHIQQLETEIEQLLNQTHQWREAAQHLRTIPGIGLLTAAWILTATHCFVRCDTPQQAAAYAGLVPHQQQSGQSKKKGKTGGGHKTLRTMLYMAAGSALQHNPILSVYYQKLLKRGKIRNVARVAVARKLMHLAWAVVDKKCDFDPNYASKLQLAA